MFGRRRVGALVAGGAAQALQTQTTQSRSCWGQTGGGDAQAVGGGWGEQAAAGGDAQAAGGGWGDQATGGGWGDAAAGGEQAWGDGTQTAGEFQAAEPIISDDTISNELYSWDHGDLFEYTIDYFRTIVRNTGKEDCPETKVAKANVAVLTPRLSELTANECAQLCVCSNWPEEWCQDPILGATFEVLRARIWQEAPGLEGDEAAHCFISINKPNNGLLKAVVRYRAEHEAAQKAQYGGQASPQGIDAGMQEFNLRMLKVIKYNINDIKAGDILLDMAVTAKAAHDVNEMPVDFYADWWPLMMRRFQAFEALKRLNPRQSLIAVRTILPMVEDKFDLTCLAYPMLFEVNAALQAADSGADQAVQTSEEAAAKLTKLTKFSPEDFFDYIGKASLFMSHNDFKAMNPLVIPLIKPFVDTCTDPKFISAQVAMLNKSKNSNVVWINAVVSKMMEFDAAKPGCFSFSEVSLMLALVSKLPSTTVEEVATHPKLHEYIQFALTRLVTVAEEFDQAKTLYFADILTSLLISYGRTVKHWQTWKTEEGPAAIARIKQLVIEPTEVVLVDYLALRMRKNIWSSTFKADAVMKFTNVVANNTDLNYLNKEGSMPQLLNTLEAMKEFVQDSVGKVKPSFDLQPKPEAGARSKLYVKSNGALAMYKHLQKPHHWLATTGKPLGEKKAGQLKKVLVENDDSLGLLDSLGSLVVRYGMNTDLPTECPRVLTVVPRNADGTLSGPLPVIAHPVNDEVVKVVLTAVAEKAVDIAKDVGAGGAKAASARGSAKRICFYFKVITEDEVFANTTLRKELAANTVLAKVWKDLRTKLGDSKLASVEWDPVTEDTVAAVFQKIDPNAIPEPVAVPGATVLGSATPVAAAAGYAAPAQGWDQSQQVPAAAGGWGGGGAAVDPNAQAGGWGGGGAAVDPNAQAGGWGGGGAAVDPNAQAGGWGGGGGAAVDPNAQAGGWGGGGGGAGGWGQ